MASFEMNILLIWALLYAFFALYIFYRSWRRVPDQLGGFPLEDLTVLVPFRDEAENLPKFLESLTQQTQLPKAILFIDDHSTDGGANLIHKKLEGSGINFLILSQEEGSQGKKQATERGVNEAKTLYCLTLDADTFFDSYYFEALPNPHSAKLITFPVQLKGSNFITRLFELEYASFQLAQAASSPNNPILASGANLIFDRQTYFEYAAKKQVSNAGDDHGLLIHCKSEKLKIQSFVHPYLNVYTAAPSNLNDLMRQRMRWLGNNRLGSDAYTKSFTFSALILQWMFLALSLILIENHDYQGLSGFIFAKLILDFILHLTWFASQKNWKLVPYLLVLSPFYPIFLLSLVLRFIFFRKKLTWKGRRI